MVILFSDHRMILSNEIKRMRRFYFIVMVFVAVLSLALLPITSNENATVDDPHYRIIQLLRNKPLTIGQALSVSEVILEQANDVPIGLILAVIDVESQFFPYAQSNRGARGLMQLRKTIFEHYLKQIGQDELRGHRFDVVLNVRIGTMYLADLYRIYNDWPKALRHYYCGNATPSKQADRYVKSVMTRANEYKYGG